MKSMGTERIVFIGIDFRAVCYQKHFSSGSKYTTFGTWYINGGRWKETIVLLHLKRKCLPSTIGPTFEVWEAFYWKCTFSLRKLFTVPKSYTEKPVPYLTDTCSAAVPLCSRVPSNLRAKKRKTGVYNSCIAFANLANPQARRPNRLPVGWFIALFRLRMELDAQQQPLQAWHATICAVTRINRSQKDIHKNCIKK